MLEVKGGISSSYAGKGLLLSSPLLLPFPLLSSSHSPILLSSLLSSLFLLSSSLISSFLLTYPPLPLCPLVSSAPLGSSPVFSSHLFFLLFLSSPLFPLLSFPPLLSSLMPHICSESNISRVRVEPSVNKVAQSEPGCRIEMCSPPRNQTNSFEMIPNYTLHSSADPRGLRNKSQREGAREPGWWVNRNGEIGAIKAVSFVMF